MAAFVEVPGQTVTEPISVATAANWVKATVSDDNAILAMLITAARVCTEAFTGRTIAKRQMRQSLDSFPYFTDSVISQLAYPPSYYAMPKYSTTLWNYSQMIKLFGPPLISVDRITYRSAGDQQFHDLVPAPLPWYPEQVYAVDDQITDENADVQTCTTPGTSGNNPPVWATNETGVTTETSGVVWRNDGPAPKTTFLVDTDSEPARVFPGPAGAVWPAALYVPNSVQIYATMGYADGKVPATIQTAILMCVANWYENREAAQPGSFSELPNHVKSLLWASRVYDMQPTRG